MACKKTFSLTALPALLAFVAFAAFALNSVAAMGQSQPSEDYYWCSINPPTATLGKGQSQDYSVQCGHYVGGMSQLIDCPALFWSIGGGIGDIREIGDNPIVRLTITKDYTGMRYLTATAKTPEVFQCKSKVYAPATTPTPIVTGTKHLFSLQGLVKAKASQTPATLTVKIYKYSDFGTGDINCGGAELLHTDAFNNVFNDDGTFDVLVGSTGGSLYLDVNSFYWLQVLVDGEAIDFGGNGCLKFESFAGPGPYDVIEGPINLDSVNGPLTIYGGLNSYGLAKIIYGSGGGLRVGFEDVIPIPKPLIAFFGGPIWAEYAEMQSASVTNNLWVKNAYVSDDLVVKGIPMGDYFSSYISYPSPSKTDYMQIYAGNVTISTGTTATVNLPPGMFPKPKCSGGGEPTLIYFVTLNPDGAYGDIARVSSRTKSSFTITATSRTYARTWDFIVAGANYCVYTVPIPSVPTPLPTAET